MEQRKFVLNVSEVPGEDLKDFSRYKLQLSAPEKKKGGSKTYRMQLNKVRRLFS